MVMVSEARDLWSPNDAYDDSLTASKHSCRSSPAAYMRNPPFRLGSIVRSLGVLIYLFGSISPLQGQRSEPRSATDLCGRAPWTPEQSIELRVTSPPGVTPYDDGPEIVLQPGDELHLRWTARAMNFSSEILLEVSFTEANGERTVVHWSGNPPYERYIQDDYQAEFLEVAQAPSYMVRMRARTVRRPRENEGVSGAATVCWHIVRGAASF